MAPTSAERRESRQKRAKEFHDRLRKERLYNRQLRQHAEKSQQMAKSLRVALFGKHLDYGAMLEENRQEPKPISKSERNAGEKHRRMLRAREHHERHRELQRLLNEERKRSERYREDARIARKAYFDKILECAGIKKSSDQVSLASFQLYAVIQTKMSQVAKVASEVRQHQAHIRLLEGECAELREYSENAYLRILTDNHRIETREHLVTENKALLDDMDVAEHLWLSERKRTSRLLREMSLKDDIIKKLEEKGADAWRAYRQLAHEQLHTIDRSHTAGGRAEAKKRLKAAIRIADANLRDATTTTTKKATATAKGGIHARQREFTEYHEQDARSWRPELEP